MTRRENLRKKFAELYGREPEKYAKGPGRVDLLGIHTDYNDVFVATIAVDLDVIVCGSRRNDSIVRIYSANMDDTAEFDIEKNAYDKEKKWSNYSRGVVKYLKEFGAEFGGADIVLESNLPIGSGLSSSVHAVSLFPLNTKSVL